MRETYQSPDGRRLKDMLEGEWFTGHCILRDVDLRQSRRGNSYLVLEVGDASGRLKAFCWKDARKKATIFRAGDLVKIRACVRDYGGAHILNIEQIRKLRPEEVLQRGELLPQSPRAGPELTARFEAHLDSIVNPPLRNLLIRIFDEPGLRNAYCRTPAGKLWHHNYLGGLLEHVVVTLDLANVLLHTYDHLDSCLLKTGIICHGLGKIRAFQLNGYIDFSTEGRLIGESVLACELLNRCMEAITGFPPELRLRLLHMIVSCRTDEPADDRIAPMTAEAVALRYLCLLDVQVNALSRIIAGDLRPGERWTRYNPLLRRFIYVGKAEAGSKTGGNGERG